MSLNTKNWRFNPFTETFNPVAITGELHTVVFDAEANAYGFRLKEGVQLIGSLPFNVHSDYEIIEDVSGSVPFVENARGVSPSAGHFRVDYDALTYYSLSFVEFNAADNGKNFICKYRGTGTIVKGRYREDIDFVVPNLVVEGDAEIDDNLSVGIDLNVGGNSNISGNEIVDGTFELAGQLINEFDTDGALAANSDNKITTQKAVKTYIDALEELLTSQLPFRHYEKIIASGTWTRPADVDFVFVKIVGGGGGGGGGSVSGSLTYGGGGGGSGCIRNELIAVSGNVAVAIGAGGTAGAINAGGGNGGDSNFGGFIADGGQGGNNGAIGLGGSGKGRNGTGFAFAGNNGGDAAAGLGALGGNGGGIGSGKGGTTASSAGSAALANSGGGGGGGGIHGPVFAQSAGGAGGSGYIELWY